MTGFAMNYIQMGENTKKIVKFLEECSHNFSEEYGCRDCPDLKECKSYFDTYCTYPIEVNDAVFKRSMKFFKNLKRNKLCTSEYPCFFRIRGNECTNENENIQCPYMVYKEKESSMKHIYLQNHKL